MVIEYSSKPISYKKLKVDNIILNKPEKINGVYKSNVYYKNDDDNTLLLLIQTPDVEVKENSVSFTMVKKGLFLTLLEDINEKIINIIKENSKKFFNDKVFSEDKIRKSLKSLFFLNEQGEVVINNVCIDKNVEACDSFNEKCKLPEFPFQAKCILKVEAIKFVKKDIIPQLRVSNVKISIQKKKIEECILDDQEDSVDSPIETEAYTYNDVDEKFDYDEENISENSSYFSE